MLKSENYDVKCEKPKVPAKVCLKYENTILAASSAVNDSAVSPIVTWVYL